MPLLALHRFRAHVSKKYFYNFGIHCVNKAAYTLFFTLLFICFLSYSVVREHIYPTRQLDFIDGYAWPFSPHVTLKHTTSDSDFVIQQLYITTHQRTITKDLLNNAADIYTSLTTLTLGDVSLQDICITSPQSTCLVHSPLEYWNNNLDLAQSDHDVVETINKQMHSTSNTTQLSLHPFTMMGNVTFDDSGHFESADSIIMTFLLKNNTLEMWDALWQHTLKELELYQKQLEVYPLSLQYELKILPSITTHTVIVILCAIGILTYIKVCFSRSHLFKSTTGLGMAVLVSSIACYTTTIGLLELFLKQTYVTPWFVQIFVCTTATLEHALLLTGAVASRRKDISVKERIGKGYQQVGILMTSTLIGELFVLVIGSTIHDDNIKSFCMFSSVAIIFAYVLNLTLYTAILSIDIRRAELTDLGIDGDKKNDDLHNHDNYGRKFKTRRAINALFLCFILLYLSAFKPTVEQSIQINKTQHKQLSSISANFWHVVNPLQNTVSLTIQPIRVVFTNKEDESAINHQVTCLTSYYDEKLHALQAAISDDRGFDINPFVLFLLRVNIPNITLIIIFIGILMWTIPPIREQLLLPFLRIVYIRIFKLLLLTTSKLMPFIKIDYLIKKVQREYSEEGVHIGAISIQSQYNKLQNESNVKNVKVQTLLGKHVADISSLDSKGNKVMSVDQYGKIILWNSKKDEWMARLDCLLQVKGKRWFAEKNPYYFTKQADIKTLSITQLPRAQCVQVDLEGKCGIAGFEDGTVRVWDLDTVQLVHELSVKEKIQHDSTTKNPSERVVKIVFLEEEGRNSSSKSILSVHKSGIIREWNISSGEMIQNINSGHAREITNICVVYNNQHSNQLYIFTSSKDGMIRCWNRNQGRWSYRYTIQEKSEVTSIATEQLHNGMGILVSGSVDGAVKVWNIHTGDILSTLSKASAIKKVVPEIEVGGPILQFSRVTESSNDFHSSYNNLLNKQNMSISNHSDAVCQVVATRVSNPEYTNDRCPSCNTTINSGFFVASSSLDYTVHTWRLDRTEIEKNAGCTTCAKHYHRKQHYDYSAGPVSALKFQHRRKHSNYNSGDESDSNNSQAELSLRPLFLGKLPQISSHGLIFCKNMVLAGVRHHYIQSESNIFLTERDDEIQWEAWFASLQYYEPPSLEKDTSLIPVITFDLEADFSFTDPSLEKEKKSLSMQSLWDNLLLHVFSIKKVRSSAITSRTKRNSMYKEDAEDQAEKRNSVPEMYHDDDEYDANDILPFPAIRYVISTNGHGFCCDYGNFIKIVSFDDPHVNRSTEKQEYINKD